MSLETFDQTFVRDFSRNINILTSQSQSYFKPLVTQKPVIGKTFDYNNLGALRVQEKTSTNEDVKVTNAYHERRGATMKTSYLALHIDKDIQKQALIDLNSGYSKAIADAMMRYFDEVVAKAAVGSVLTGEDLATTKAFAGETLDITSSGLTFDKLRELRKKFRAKGVGAFADDEICVAISEKEEEQLLGEVKLTSKDYGFADYNAKRAQMEQVLGMKFLVLPSNPDNSTGILDVSGSERTCFAFSTKAIQVGVRHQLSFEIDNIPQKVNTLQLKAIYAIGALRTEDARVIKITATA